jgi:hypothetical protein
VIKKEVRGRSGKRKSYEKTKSCQEGFLSQSPAKSGIQYILLCETVSFCGKLLNTIISYCCHETTSKNKEGKFEYEYSDLPSG